MKKLLVYLSIGFLVIYSFLVSIFFYLNNIVSTPSVSVPTQISESKLVELTNQYRLDNGLAVLQDDYALCGYALQRLEEVQANWNHDGFFSSYEDFYNQTDAIKLGENLSKDFFGGQEQSIMTAWVNSPSHKANLDNKVFTHLCIQCEDKICVQEFASYPR